MSRPRQQEETTQKNSSPSSSRGAKNIEKMSSNLARADPRGLYDVPLGCRLLLCVCLVAHVAPTGLLECSPFALFTQGKFWTLVTTTYVHTSWLSLAFAFLLGWRRFVRVEHENGTLGMLVWFTWASFVLHLCYCLVCKFLLAQMDPALARDSVHGLWPIILLLLTTDARQDPYGEVVLAWPLSSVKVYVWSGYTYHCGNCGTRTYRVSLLVWGG